MRNYLDDLFTPSVLDIQDLKGSLGLYPTGAHEADRLADDEITHISSSDSFYMATISESGWPYVQHKGGEAGFVKVLAPDRIGWAERIGNRQYLGTGNVAGGSMVALIFVDYASRTRIKIRGDAEYHPNPSPEMIETLSATDVRVDGAVTVDIVATAWNCPKYITPRYTTDQIEGGVQPLRDRIADLEAQLEALRTPTS